MIVQIALRVGSHLTSGEWKLVHLIECGLNNTATEHAINALRDHLAELQKGGADVK